MMVLAEPRVSNSIVALGIGSVVVIFSSIDVEGSSFAVFASMLSFVVCIGVLVLARKRPRLLVREVLWCHLQDPWPERFRYSCGGWGLVEAVAVFLAGWWVLTAGVLTFRGPFLTVGNGFFASWAACAA